MACHHIAVHHIVLRSMACSEGRRERGAHACMLLALRAASALAAHTRMRACLRDGEAPLTWLPLVFGPLLAMLKMPAPVCLSSFVISSSNLPP